MALTSGTKLGPYEIVAPVGAGGMGEVYRALDTRLNRTVAVKILPSHLAEDADAKQRFDREAHSISSLNHPNICTLYDVGHQDGTDYLVMEFLEGQTLAERLVKGALPAEQVLKYGREICEGLEKAHKSGVIHRDLKPGNIMLTKTGAKLMDFGLAKSAPAIGPPSSSLTSSLTATMNIPESVPPLTAKGTVVGTFQYMSPEQVEGQEADARSDIFSLGAVLYEMASGKRAFEGKTTASIIAAVLAAEPQSISAIQPTTPLALDRVVKTCLAKDADERFQTVHDLNMQLRWIAEGGVPTSQIGVLPTRRRTNSLAWGLAAAGILGAAIFAGLYFLRTPPLPSLIVSSIPAPDKANFLFLGDLAGPPVFSRDGRSLVFVAAPARDASRLYVRSLDSVEAVALPGTENALSPFWSPDGRKIAFFAGGKLRVIEVLGGGITSVCDALTGRGGSWGDDGTIILAPGFRGPIYRVPASGGTPVPVTQVDESKHTSHRWPFFLPDGNHFLYLAINHQAPQGENDTVYFASLDGKENRPVFHSVTNAQYASGSLLFVKSGVLEAQPFDPATGKLADAPQPIANGVAEDGDTWRAVFGVSGNGLLAYAGGSQAQTQLAWVDRTGKQLGTVGEKFGGLSQGQFGLRMSPNGDRAALSISGSMTDVWIQDLLRGARSRLTFGPVGNNFPVWSPDGKWVAYTAITKEGNAICRRPAGGGAEEVVLKGEPSRYVFPNDWSQDGKYLLYSQGSPGTSQEILATSLVGDGKPFVVIPRGNFYITGPRFSPNGHWVMYQSTESGRPEIYVVPFPGGQGKSQVSTTGGQRALWSEDGKEVFFTTIDRMLISVSVKEVGGQIHVGTPQELFRLPTDVFSPAPGGKKFLLNLAGDQDSKPMTLVTNWTSVLKK